MTDTPDKVRVFRECGAALEQLGRSLKLGKQLIDLGRDLRRVGRADLAEEKLFTLRKPVDDFRALVDGLGTAVDQLRALLDVLSEAVGYDSN